MMGVVLPRRVNLASVLGAWRTAGRARSCSPPGIATDRASATTLELLATDRAEVGVPAVASLLAATPDRVGCAFLGHAQGGVEVGDAGTDVTADGVALAA